MAYSNSTPKGENVSSTLLTPCRPVGLRRKRPSPKYINSPQLKTSKTDLTRISPVTPISCVSSRAQQALDHQDGCLINSSPSCELENQENEGRKNLKRKSYTLQKNNSPKKRPIPRNIIKSCAIQGNDSLRKSGFESSTSQPEEDQDNGKATGTCSTKLNHGEGVSHICQPLFSSPSSFPREISPQDVEQLKERVARKEKTLKELKLAALYKKKHDFDQVEKEINCWVEGCKEALYDLQSELKRRDQVYSLTKLLGTLGIPPSLIGIEEDDVDCI